MVKMFEAEGSVWHISVLNQKDRVGNLANVKLNQTAESNFAISYGSKWWAPPNSLVHDGRGYDLKRKTKGGVFIYEEV
jgi:hypothetical protein